MPIFSSKAHKLVYSQGRRMARQYSPLGRHVLVVLSQ